MNDRIDERKEERVTRDGDHVRKVEIREDLAAERNRNVRKLSSLIWIASSGLEFLLALRVLLKAIAANPNNTFATFVYGFTELFVWPFNGLTATPNVNGFVLDIPAIIAMLVYMGAAWILAQIVRVLFSSSRSKRISTYEQS